MEANTVLVILMFVTFMGLLFTGYPVAFVLAGVAMLFCLVGYISDLYFGTITGLDYLTIGLVVNRIYKVMDNWLLVALPMFILMGHLLDHSGVAERMMHSFQRLLGRVHGGLAISIVAMGMILAASTGIIGASVVLLTVMTLPLLQKQGYSIPLATGTIAASGTLGILIPPSIMLVIMADQLGLSVGDLFVGALIPGLTLGFCYLIYLVIYGMVSPKSAPLPAEHQDLTLAIALDAIKAALPAVLLIFAVLGSIFAGIATPTEASGIGVLGTILLAAWNKRLSFSMIKDSVRMSYSTTANIFGIFIGATAFALVLRELGGDQVIEDALTSIPFGKYAIIVVILLIIFLLGFFLDWIEITLIVLPLMAPVVEKLGFGFDGYGVVDYPDLLWFVLLTAVALQTSFLTPPVGFALFYMKGAAPPGIKITDIYRGVWPFVLIQLFVLALVLIFPAMVNWLPAYVYG